MIAPLVAEVNPSAARTVTGVFDLVAKPVEGAGERSPAPSPMCPGPSRSTPRRSVGTRLADYSTTNNAVLRRQPSAFSLQPKAAVDTEPVAAI